LDAKFAFTRESTRDAFLTKFNGGLFTVGHDKTGKVTPQSRAKDAVIVIAGGQ
jgi:hypothetical protein